MSQIASPSLNSPPSRLAPQDSGPADDAVVQFAALYRANVAAVTAYFARRSAEPQTVADLTADTFVAAITSFATFDPRKGTPRAWVFGIARRIYATHCRAHSQQRSGAGAAGGPPGTGPDEAGDLIDRIDAERAGRALVTGLTTLPAADRAVVELVDLAGLQAKEAAQVLGIAPGSSAPAYAAYSVTRHHGTVTVSVYRASGVAGANAALQRMHTRAVVVPVRPGCPLIGSLPHPQPAPHPAVWAAAGVNGHGHRSVSVKIKGSIPAGDTMILAFTGSPRTGSVGAGGIITGPVPRCVSLPPAPSP